MFTGLIAAQGQVVSLVRSAQGGVLTLRLPPPVPPGLDHPPVGASIAVNGVCLTVRRWSPSPWTMEADLMPETLKVTALGDLTPGETVNLEPALKLGDALDGHLVSGDVDGTGRVEAQEVRDNALVVRIVPQNPQLLRFVVLRGRIAIDGASLTVMERSSRHLGVSLIPLTQKHIRLGKARPGTQVNLETDLLARHYIQYQEGLHE